MSKRANIIAIAVLVGLMLAFELLPVSRFLAQQPDSGTPIPADLAVIRFGGGESFAYNPLNLTIPAGSSVEWQGNFGTHPLASDTQFWYPHRDGTTFRQTFGRAGTYRFYCEIHGAPNGAGMSGVITVQ